MCLLDIAVFTNLLNTNTTDSNKIKHLLLTTSPKKEALFRVVVSSAVAANGAM